MLFRSPKEKVLLEGEEFEIDPREELVMKILEYKKFKEAADKLKELEKENSKTYYKLKEDLSIYEEEEINFDEFDLELLVNSLNEMIARRFLNEVEVNFETIKKEEYRISDCIDNIFNKLKEFKSIEFYDLIAINAKKNEIIAYFLSLLELIKTKDIIVKQEGAFSELIIERVAIEEN